MTTPYVFVTLVIIHTALCCSKHVQTKMFFNLYLFPLCLWEVFGQSVYLSEHIYIIVPIEDTVHQQDDQNNESKKSDLFPF